MIEVTKPIVDFEWHKRYNVTHSPQTSCAFTQDPWFYIHPANDIPAIIRHFGSMDHIVAMLVRNVRYLSYHHFRDAAHLTSTGDLDIYAIMKSNDDTCPDNHIFPTMYA